MIESADSETMGEIFLMCSEESARSKKRVMALYARGLMKLLEKGYNPARGQNRDKTDIGRAFTEFWYECQKGTLHETGKTLFTEWSRNKKMKEVWGTTSTPELDRLPAERIWVVQRVISSRSKLRKRYQSEVGSTAAIAGGAPRARTSSLADSSKRQRGPDPRRGTAEGESDAMSAFATRPRYRVWYIAESARRRCRGWSRRPPTMSARRSARRAAEDRRGGAAGQDAGRAA